MANNKIDKTPPKLSKSSPTANKQSVELNSDIVFTFDEKIKSGTGNIVITDGTDTRLIPITDAQVKISDKTITINPSVDFFPNSNYIVKISSTAIQDLTGNPYKETKAPLSFTTKNGIAPVGTKPTTSTDTLAPVFTSATVNGNALVMTLKDDGLLSTDTALPNVFSVVADGIVNPVTDVFINPTAKTVALHLTNVVAKGQVVTVGYTDPTNGNDVNALQDVAGNDVASFLTQPVKNNTQAITPSTPVVITPTEPKFTLSSDTQSVDEGKSITFTVTSDIAAPTSGFNIPYELSGTALIDADYAGSKDSGIITIVSGQKTGALTLNTISDSQTEDVEAIVFSTLSTGLNPISVTINDKSVSISNGDSEGKLTTKTIATGFNFPLGVAADSKGNVYVADYSGNDVKKIAPDGNVTTLLSGLKNPSDVGIDNADNIYVVEHNGNAIKKVLANGTVSTLTSEVKSPEGVTIDNAGNVYVIEQAGNIKKIAPNGDITTVLSGLGYSSSRIAVDNSNNLYFTADGGNIKKVTPSGDVSTVFTMTNATNIKVDSVGNIYTAVDGNIKKIAPNGTVGTISSGLDNATGIAIDNSGNAYITSIGGTSNGNITEILNVNTTNGLVLNGTTGNDTLTGGAGNDTINGNGGDDSIGGGDGNDIINAGKDSSRSISIDGGAGDDLINVTQYADGPTTKITGGAGKDTITLNGDNAVYTITDFKVGEDVLKLNGNMFLKFQDIENPHHSYYFYTSKLESSFTNKLESYTLVKNISDLYPLADHLSDFDYSEETTGQTIVGTEFNDNIIGSSADDTITGGAGHDDITGGLGNDAITGGAGDDDITGDLGDDILTGGTGSDMFVVNAGKDTVTDFALGSDTLTVTKGTGAVRVNVTFADGTMANYNVTANATTDVTIPATVKTAADLNKIAGISPIKVSGINWIGTDKNDTFIGGAGDDTITGGKAADTLTGGKAADTLTGGKAADTLTGGLGGDTFVFGGAANNLEVKDTALGERSFSSVDLIALNGSSPATTIDTSKMDVITDWGIGDKIQFRTTTGLNVTSTNNNAANGISNNKVDFIRGNYDSKYQSFGSVSTTGNDILAISDTDPSTALSYDAVVIIGGANHITIGKDIMFVD